MMASASKPAADVRKTEPVVHLPVKVCFQVLQISRGALIRSTIRAGTMARK
jgi:hypothetical protein